MGKKEKQVIGVIDKVDLPEFGIEAINAKIDTGAHRSSLHCKKIKVEDDRLFFSIQTDDGYKEFSSIDWMQKRIRSSNGKAELRYVTKTKLRVFEKDYKVSFSLTDRSKMKYPLLIGRMFLKGKFLVDVAKKNVSFQKKVS